MDFLSVRSNPPTGESTHAPLAYKLRPDCFEDFQGQDKVLQALDRFDSTKNAHHLIFWGPPGCGKTTLAYLLANKWGYELFPFNAVMCGVAELRKLIKSIEQMYELHAKKSIIFIDEIHRFNKAQQDALLPHLERGDFILLGATTENPRTSLNKAIQSRVQSLQLYELTNQNIKDILIRANKRSEVSVTDEVLNKITHYAHGDARYALNKLELFTKIQEKAVLKLDQVDQILKEDARQFDKSGDRHYDVISAYIKSIRGSDPDAAILWLAVMLEGGEDPFFIARRLVIAASEDVGNANPQALSVATAALHTVQHVGMPEARIPLAQATVYLACSPKSNASYLAIDKALDFVRNSATIEVPTHLRNHHPDKKQYKYAHNYPKHYVDQEYMPEKWQFYEPTELGFEVRMKQWMEQLKSSESSKGDT